MVNNVKAKGANAERELSKIIQAQLGVEMKRNLDQTREGGYDLLGLNLAIEVKRQEKPKLSVWWAQAVEQAKNAGEEGKIPVLAYRGNHQPWRFVLPGFLLTGAQIDDKGCAHVHNWEMGLEYTITLYLDGFIYWCRENAQTILPESHAIH